MAPGSDPPAHGCGQGDVELGTVLTHGHDLPAQPVVVGHGLFTISLVEEFFKVLHLVPSFSFLHPRSTKEHLLEASLDEALAFAICTQGAKCLYGKIYLCL